MSEELELQMQIVAYAMACLIELKVDKSYYDLYQIAHSVLASCTDEYMNYVLEHDDLDSEIILEKTKKALELH